MPDQKSLPKPLERLSRSYVHQYVNALFGPRSRPYANRFENWFAEWHTQFHERLAEYRRTGFDRTLRRTAKAVIEQGVSHVIDRTQEEPYQHRWVHEEVAPRLTREFRRLVRDGYPLFQADEDAYLITITLAQQTAPEGELLRREPFTLPGERDRTGR